MSIRGSLELVALRLPPGTDVRQGLKTFAQQELIRAGVIVGAVGSLSTVCLRFAGQDSHTTLNGKHEILTLSGTLGTDGVHLHMTVANSQGECIGGHVVNGCQIYTTLELVIATLPNIQFQRLFDPVTGCRELSVKMLGKEEL